MGGRKGKNVRNHIWILNGIICDVLSSKKKHPVDLQLFDYRQCFDSLWLDECLSDLFNSGVRDDKLALLHNINSHVKIAIKTPVGKTETEDIYNVITQGDVFGPLLCSNLVDKIGKECILGDKYLYSYKGIVDVPPLGMVDDLVCVSECGPEAVMMNSYVNAQTNLKKLQFGPEKCKQLHVGKEGQKCQSLTVEKWIEIEVQNDESDKAEIVDKWDGNITMAETEEEKYLGDIISVDGRNIKNVKARVAKGKGIIRKIITLLDGIPFGRHFFEVGIMLRNSLHVSSVLFNCEASMVQFDKS